MLSWSLLFLTSLSCAACILSVWCWFRVRKALRGASTVSLTRLSGEVAELQSALESLAGQHRRLAARVGMREVRHRREEADEAAETKSNGVDRREQLRQQARARGLMR